MTSNSRLNFALLQEILEFCIQSRTRSQIRNCIPSRGENLTYHIQFLVHNHLLQDDCSKYEDRYYFVTYKAQLLMIEGSIMDFILRAVPDSAIYNETAEAKSISTGPSARDKSRQRALESYNYRVIPTTS